MEISETFVTADQLVETNPGGYVEITDFGGSVNELFKSLIIEIANIGNGVGQFIPEQSIDNYIHMNFYFQVNLNPSPEPTGYYNRYDLGTVTELATYVKNNLNDKIIPYVKQEFLNRVGLSENQFIIRVKNLKVYPTVQTNKNIQPCITNILVTIEFDMSIQDMSGFIPGGEYALKIKYNNLCSSYTTQSVDELRDWARTIGVRNYMNLLKEQLCEAIKSTYGW